MRYLPVGIVYAEYHLVSGEMSLAEMSHSPIPNPQSPIPPFRGAR